MLSMVKRYLDDCASKGYIAAMSVSEFPPMTDKPKRDFTRVALRLYATDAERFEAVRKALSGPHLEATEAAAAKFIFELGTAAAEKKLGVPPPAKKASK
jgi:hypothetical protein